MTDGHWLEANDSILELFNLKNIEFAGKKEITLVVLDLQMPEMNGKETYFKIWERYPNLKIAISSGYEKVEELQ